MSDFIVVPPYDYVAELLRLVPCFAASIEFNSLDREDRTSPGLVFAAFAKFMEMSFADQNAIAECRDAIERFAMRSVEAHNLIVTEVFENFRNPEISAILLLPISRDLYDRWIV